MIVVVGESVVVVSGAGAGQCGEATIATTVANAASQHNNQSICLFLLHLVCGGVNCSCFFFVKP